MPGFRMVWGDNGGPTTVPVALIAAALVLSMTIVVAAGDGSTVDYGEYVHLGIVHDLDGDDVTVAASEIRVDAPTGTSEIRVDISVLDAHLGEWEADEAYQLSPDCAIIEDGEATFRSFAPDPELAFTRGSADSIRLVERPMWLAVDVSDDRIKITADAVDTTGQPLRLDGAWLADHGIDRPVVVHEEGFALDVEETSDGSGFVLDVPHFSDLGVFNAKLNTDWMDDEDAQNTFYHTDQNDILAYNTTIEDSSGGNVTFLSTWTVNDTIEDYSREMYNESTRESVERSGYYSYNYINETNLVNGQARIFRDTFDLVDVTSLAYVFENGSRRLHYDYDEGFLRLMERTDSGDFFEVVSRDNGTLDPDAPPADDLFEAYELHDLPPNTVKDDLADGRISFEFFGTLYNLSVAQVPWEADIQAAGITKNGTVAPMTSDFERVAYNGTVEGEPDSRALVMVSESGVGGTIQTENQTVYFEPETLLTENGSVGVSVAFHPSDRMPRGGSGGEFVHIDNTSTSSLSYTHSSGADRLMTIWADSEMVNSDSNWDDTIFTAYNRMKSRWENSPGWSFSLEDDTVYYCDDTDPNLCDNLDWGMTSTEAGTLLQEWGEELNQADSINGDEFNYEVAKLVTGKDLVGADGSDPAGAAWTPGRYGVTEGGRPQDEVTTIFRHEVGHPFNANHGDDSDSYCPPEGDGRGQSDRAECYDHWHSDPWKHCHNPPHDVYKRLKDLGIDFCQDPHWHDNGEWHKHYTMMWWTIDVGDGKIDPYPSEDNWKYLRNCNSGAHGDGIWTHGSYEPGGSGFGEWCDK